MAEVLPKFGWPGLQITFNVAEAIVGGQIVEFRTGTRTVGVAASGSTKVAGVARWDVPAARTTIQQKQVGDGNELTVCRNCIVAVTAKGAVAVGDKLIVGATAGTASAAGAAPDARTVIGEAYSAAADGATLLAYVY